VALLQRHISPEARRYWTSHLIRGEITLERVLELVALVAAGAAWPFAAAEMINGHRARDREEDAAASAGVTVAVCGLEGVRTGRGFERNSGFPSEAR